MAVELKYKHQQKIHKAMKEELKRSKRAAYESPTGTGKTFPGLKHVEENPDKTVLIVVPSTLLKNQWKKNIENFLDNGKERLKSKNIVLVTYQKVALLLKKAKHLKADIIIIDEAHRIGAETFEPAIDELIESQPDAEVIAMTATPMRTDKRNMLQEKFGNHIVYEMSLTEALSGEKEGEVILRSPRYVRVLSQLMPQIREYKERISYIEDEEKRQRLLKRYERLESIVSNSPDIQDVMLAGMQKKNGKYIVFCKDREDMIEKMAQVQEIFGKVNSNIQSEYVISKNERGDTFGKTEAQNRRTLEKFESSDRNDALQLLFCVDKLNEGVHIDGIDGEVLFDLTKSPVLYKQRIGRVTSPNGETVIIDAVNNWINQIDTYYELENAIRKGQSNGKEENQDYDLLKLSPEETDLLEILREIGEGLRYHDNKTYEEIIKWLEEHDGNMPRGGIKRNGKILEVKEMTEKEKYERNLYARWFYCIERKILNKYEGRPIEEVPEEYKEKILTLRQYGYGLTKKTTYEEIIEWLEENQGNMPRGGIKRNGKLLKAEHLTEEEKLEINLYKRWRNSEERKIVEEYIGRPIEEVPEEYQEKISILRQYGYGLTKKTTYEEIIEWLEKHEGNMPRGDITRGGTSLKVEYLTEKEKFERRLYDRWNKSKERKILDEYVGRPIEDVPEEYREKVRNLREFGYGLEKETIYEEIIEWLEKHEGNMPRGAITRGGTSLKVEHLTEKEKFERRLYDRWNKSEERKILDKYVGRPIEDVPEEYREKVRNLREFGYGLEKETIYEEIIEWLEKHEGNMPRGDITRGGTSLKVEHLTEKEKSEKSLYHRWNRSKERKILDEYAGRPIEEVPKEYREQVRILREYGYGLDKRTTYEEIVEWLEMHEGIMPNKAFYGNGKNKTIAEMTEEEKEETRLRARWEKSKIRKILDEYVGRPIEEVPEEYREKIAKLRSLGQLGTKKDDKIKGKMKKAVGKAVGQNEEVREELGEIKRS